LNISDTVAMKPPKEQKTITKQVSRRLEEMRPMLKKASGIQSWVDYVRLGLGMGLTQLAARLGITQSSVSSSIN
jgi:hypothetical protein